jgi:hypothetical protein
MLDLNIRMFALRKHRPRPKKGIKGEFSFPSPSLLPVRDLLKLYSLPEDLVTAGALCDAFLNDEISHSGYEAWKKTLSGTYGDKVCSLVISALESDSEKDSDVFVLKSAILINKISRLASLSESELDEWISEVRDFTDSKKKDFQPPYKDAHQDMGAYLQNALSYVSNATA